MKTAPSEASQGAAEEIVEVNNDEKELVGYLDAPNKDTNTPAKPPPATSKIATTGTRNSQRSE